MPGEQDFIGKFTELFESWPDAFFILSSDGAIVSCNAGARKLTGLGRGDLFAMPVQNIFRDSLLSRSIDELSENRSGEMSFRSVCTAKNGTETAVGIELRTFGSKGIDYLLLSARDLSEQEKGRGEIERLESTLRHSRRLEMMGRIAGGIIHYYNNIFTGIIGALDVALRETAPGTVLDLLKRAKRAANTASGYSKRLLAFTRDETKSVAPTDIGALLDDIGDFARLTFDRHISVDISYAGGLRPVIADPADLHHMLLNLVVNARDAVKEKLERLSREGSAAITVEAVNMHLDRKESIRNPDASPGDFVLLKVADTGIGMDEVTRRRMFDPYFSTKEAGKGTGIGLAAVFETVRGCGGWIEIDSEPGNGTAFRVFLPSVILQQEVSRETEEADLPTGSEMVLIVDDDDMIRTLGTMTLERQGYTVCPASNAAECLDNFMKHRDSAELLILDLSLPDRPGEKLLEDIRRLKSEISVIVTSGRDFAHDRKSFDVLRADDYLTKPFTIGDLAVSVRNILDRKIVRNS